MPVTLAATKRRGDNEEERWGCRVGGLDQELEAWL
jgi:hypothetical protein